MTLDEAIQHLRSDPAHVDLVRDAFLGPDVVDSASRFKASAEFSEVVRLVGDWIEGGQVLDLGSGIGISSYAFARAGAAKVFGIEPDASDQVGLGAARLVGEGLPIEQVAAFGESLPLRNASIDLFYTRQVLHHTTDLNLTLREAARVLKPGGAFLACREHVVDDDAELAEFLKRHPVHQLAGGENAYRLDQYVGAIRDAGLSVKKTLGLYDSVINSFPAARTRDELGRVPGNALRQSFGPAGSLMAYLPWVKARVRKRLERRVPGRMYTFFALKSKTI